MHRSKECNQEIQGVVKVQHAHVEEMLGSERFGGIPWVVGQIRREQELGIQAGSRNPNVPNYSIVGNTSTKDKVRLPLTRLPHFMDRIGPLIGCLSRCRFEIDTSSYEPPPSLSKMKKLKLLRKLLVDISASVLVGRLGLDTGSSIVFDSIVFCSRIGQVRKAKAFQQPSSNKYHVRHSRWNAS